MKRPSRLRKTPTLSESVHQQLNMCARAAGAALVSVLALAQLSEAKIVYTPVNIQIGPDQHYNLDLKHDGVTEFVIQNTFFGGRNCTTRTSYVAEVPASGNGAVGSPPATLNRGAQIGHGQQFYEGSGTMASAHTRRQCSFYGEGPWSNVTDRYLGLRVQLNGRIHYGWAGLALA